MRLRPATLDDAPLLLAWRNDPDTRANSHNTAKVTLAEHRAWLEATLANPARTLWIAEDGGPVGTVRCDHGEVSELSWTVAPEARGKGVGRRMVALAVAEVGGRIRAEVKTGNHASARIAESAGMVLERRVSGVLHYVRHQHGAIVVLSHELTPKGLISDEYAARADLAAEALAEGLAPVIVTCGWAYRPGPSLAIAARDYLRAKRVFHVEAEERPKDTVGEAVFTRRYRNPLVITSDHHAARAAEIFQRVHGHPITVRSLLTNQPENPGSIEVFRAMFAGVEPEGMEARMLAAHPLYLSP